MNKKTVSKLLAGTLAFTLIFANTYLFGINAKEAIAASLNELETQNKAVDNANIEFDAYFEENGETKHVKEIDIASNNDKLYINLKVSDGYLTNAKIQIEDANFRLVMPEEMPKEVQKIDVEANTIILNQINKNESVTLEFKIKMNTDSDFDVQNIGRISNVVLEGKYVDTQRTLLSVDLKEVQIYKRIKVNAKMTANAEANLEEEVTKYIQYDVNGEKGVLLQTLVKSSIKNNVLPVKTEKIEIEIPKINNIEPSKLIVSAESTKATKGEDLKIFTEGEDYTYENRKVTLTIENKEIENGIISWEKEAVDEILVTCIYGEEAITSTAKIELKAKNEITAYDSKLNTVTSNIAKQEELKESIGQIVSFNIKTSEGTLQKGYMLVEGAANTPYVEIISANIGYKEIVDSITFETYAKYVDTYGNKYTANPKYTYTKISEENFLEILGEEGYIDIYDKDGKKIMTLDKENLEYTYKEDTRYIKVETSKPITEGTIRIENGREIISLEYSKAQEDKFEKINKEIKGKVILNNTEILKGQEATEIVLENPRTQASLTLSKENISTVVTNSNVELRVTLNTNDNSTVLYKNPVIEIEFPSYVTNVVAKKPSMLYEDELKVSKAVLFKNENGNEVIRIELGGEQTVFNKEALSVGATLIMNANITVDELTPTRTENIKTYVTNNKTGEKIEVLTPMKFVAPSGIVTVNQISNFNEKGTVATSISGKEETGELEKEAEAQTAQIKMTVINNYSYNCENIVILGRTPFEGNKDILTGEDLGSTFTAKMVNTITKTAEIDQDKIEVYYSANGEANTDLSESKNGWTQDKESLAEIKSYMIILKHFTLETGESIGFSYNVEIPGGLGYDKSMYATYAVYYCKQEEKSTQTTQVASATAVGATTGQGADLSVELTSDVEDGAEVKEGTIIKYTAKITNNLSRKQENVILVLEIPDNAYYISEDGRYISNYSIKEMKIDVGSIEANSSKYVEFSLKAGEHIDDLDLELDVSEIEILPLSEFENEEDYYSYLLIKAELSKNFSREKFNSDEEYEMYLKAVDETDDYSSNIMVAKVKAMVENYEDTFESNQIKSSIIKATEENVVLELILSSTNDRELVAGSEMEYDLEISKNTYEDLNNVIVKCTIPDGMIYLSADNGGTYDENTRIVTWKFDTFDTSKFIVLYCNADQLPEGTYEKEVVVNFTATYGENSKVFYSNNITSNIYGEGFSISQTSNILDEYITSGEEITYAITVRNLGVNTTTATISDALPEELSFIKYYYTQNGKINTITRNSGSTVDIPVRLDAGESLTIYVTLKAKEINNSSEEITNKVTLNSAQVKNLEANKISHTLIGSGYVPGDDNDSENKSEDSTKNIYRISGLAWLDSNKNGQRDDGEELQSGIKVLLLDSATNKVIASTETNENGVYIFLGVESGRYIVAFEYDTLNYDVTIYQSEGVDTSVNSDVINMTLDIDNVVGKYAATNTIVVSSNTYNIDLGLVVSPKFDLELTKAVTLIQTSNLNGINTYTFNQADVAKVEIPGKDMAGTEVAITYTFTIENTGAVSGFAKKIVDYISNDLSFSSTLNPEWYQDTDGYLYNTSLASREIEPGEKVELSLILTKTMTEENTGVVNNTAEISEASNDQGILDIDSTPGNRNVNEDDYGVADAIITVKTGGVIVYTGIVLIVIAVFAFGIYNIKKKVLNRV